MSLAIVNESAWEYWRWWRLREARVGGEGFPTGTRVTSLADLRVGFLPGAIRGSLDERATVAFARDHGLSSPVHVQLPGCSSRRPRPGFVLHTGAQWDLPWFVLVGRDAYVASPELCLLQMATSLSLGELLMRTSELCGSYCLDPFGTAHLASPLLEPDQCLAVTNDPLRMAGMAPLRQVAKWTREFAASPAEAQLTALLTLPHARGGYALPAPELHPTVKLAESAAATFGASHCEGHLFWPEHAVDLEVCGAHLIPPRPGVRQALDAPARRKALQDSGIHTLFLEPYQLASIPAADAFATHLAQLLGVRLRPRLRDFERRQRVLRRELGVFTLPATTAKAPCA